MSQDSRIATARSALALLCLLGLAGCSSSITRDWPEQQTAVTPSQQGSSGSVIGTPGNPPFYEVFGERYYVMQTADGFRERGVASWYGPNFHGKPTSGGEIFDMHSLTAAHKTLPIPTWVEVTNLKNGRQVIVRVNDRGPFVDDRIIDLSYAAASDLDMLGTGTARVQVRALGAPVGGSLDPDQGRSVQASSTESRSSGFALISAANAAPADADGRPDQLFVQVGAFSDRENALGMVARLKRSGFENTFVLAGGGRDSLYRVRIGPLADERQYDSVRAGLRSAGVRESRLVTGSP